MNKGLPARSVLWVLTFLLSVAACSNRAVYDNMRIHQRNECREQPLPTYQECLERASKPYGVYQRERSEALGQQ